MKTITLTALFLISMFTMDKTLNVNSGQTDKEFNSPVVLVIHGGAGTILKSNMRPEIEKKYRDMLTSVLNQGMELLKEGKTSVDVVEQVIRMLEDSPLFNAGKGAVFNHEGKQEMDASLMDGKSLNAGAVAGVSNIKNPISAARLVMDNSEHVMLSGKGAEQFAKEQKLELVDPDYFYNEKRYIQLKNAIKRDNIQLDHDGEDGKQGGILPGQDDKFGTVGAVSLDKYGNLAAGTSTGGMTNKKYGRVGDSPLIGAGTYANNNSCAVSCTGHGEFFIRSVVAYDVSAIMQYQNKSIKEAADYVVNTKLKNIKGAGGLIALDAKGNVAMPFNTKGMYRGVIYQDGSLEVKIYDDE